MGIKFIAEYYVHYHDHGDDEPPTIEPAVLCLESNTYITGFDSLEDAQQRADDLNKGD